MASCYIRRRTIQLLRRRENEMEHETSSNPIKKCKVCGSELAWDNGRYGLSESSSYIEDWDICRDCMTLHCSSTNCFGCSYGKYPECRFLALKNHYSKDGEKNIEIFFDDLTPEKQKEIYDRLGDNGNYDVFPIVIIPERAEE
jgi:hypothetical protein